MEEYITGLANLLNFSVGDQLIKWGNYNITVSSISIFSTGISTRYTKKEKERSGIGKALRLGAAIMVTLGQMMDEDVSEKLETLEASLNYFGSDSDLPCINLVLSNGTKMEITFTDMFSFRENVKAVKRAISENTKRKNLEMHGTEIVVEGADFHEEVFFIEEVKK